MAAASETPIPCSVPARPSASDSSSLEQYLLLLLSDSNLPTGGFIASSGLESYIQHGFLLADADVTDKTQGMLAFLTKSLASYAHLNLPFLSAAHSVVSALVQSHPTPPSSANSAPTPPPSQPAPPPPPAPRSYAQAARPHLTPDQAFQRIVDIDDEYEAMVLNHVARRASVAQGMGVLTLYERAFAAEGEGAVVADALVARLRAGIRKGEVKGHLPVAFGVMCGGLGMSLAATQHLYLFLHARSLLSSAIRLNTIGPYLSHRLLLHDVRPMVDQTMRVYGGGANKSAQRMAQGRQLWQDGWEEEEEEDGPATTWPLGELLTGRHDQLHSKIFNS